MKTIQPAAKIEATGRALRDAFAQFPSGVVAVAAEVDGTAVGMAVSAFAPVSLEPALVGIFVANDSATWPVLRSASSIGLSVLSGEHVTMARTLAGPAEHRFQGVPTSAGAGDALFIEDTPMKLEGVIAEEYPAGDHTLVLFEIQSAFVQPEHSALLFHRSRLASLGDESVQL